ncbi:MAG: hypothetical protein L6R40_001815 [Gallowayella cf. fulva]|nr:MAG: hypothetical protein L6R40_001815 [Xanthomendoza cf. fulva]
MADDGMLMNFSIGEEIPSATKPVFRGGRWKDRLIAKKAAERRYRKPDVGKPSPTPGDTTVVEKPEEDVPERQPKRQKLDGPSKNFSKPRPNITSKEVVSSLFSYNPSSTTPSSKPETPDETPAVPSNAPLPDGISKFTDLGLSPTISSHLLTKLSLKAPTAIQRSTITQLLKEDSDAFIQAETGSGKTLAYLLPIVQRLMHLSKAEGKKINRDSGLFAIILAPTRELCKQISIVLENLLRCANWIVAGTVIGGEKKKSEKARLRKGLNILVATPGRLVDHLDNTEVLDVRNVRWLVLDEGDRLVELGFEEDIRRIVQELEKRSDVVDVGKGEEMISGLPRRRTTVLCSATMKMTAQRLGEISLKDAVHIKANLIDDEQTDEKAENNKETAFLAPAQLKQSYIIVPPKQRLVTLSAFLKNGFARKGSVMKAIVFLSCADSVDFHYEVFARKAVIENASKGPGMKHSESDKENADAPSPPIAASLLPTVSQSDILGSTSNPNLMIHRLHGSLNQQTRTATLSAFTRSTNPSILFCTDVASRGLDLPNIELIVEYDPPFSSDDHLHRIGRTARAGREGRAVIFLMPGAEEGYVDLLRQGYRDGVGRGLIHTEAGDILKKGFGNTEASLAIDQKPSVDGASWSERAEQWQLEVERWVLDDKAKAGEMAKRAFVSHVRAYATHVARERAIFDVRGLHLGHLAKAFALRERPGHFGRNETAGAKKGGHRSENPRKVSAGAQSGGNLHKMEFEPPKTDRQDAKRKMQSKMKEHLAAAGEFNIG